MTFLEMIERRRIAKEGGFDSEDERQSIPASKYCRVSPLIPLQVCDSLPLDIPASSLPKSPSAIALPASRSPSPVSVTPIEQSAHLKIVKNYC